MLPRRADTAILLLLRERVVNMLLAVGLYPEQRRLWGTRWGGALPRWHRC